MSLNLALKSLWLNKNRSTTNFEPFLDLLKSRLWTFIRSRGFVQKLWIFAFSLFRFFALSLFRSYALSLFHFFAFSLFCSFAPSLFRFFTFGSLVFQVKFNILECLSRICRKSRRPGQKGWQLLAWRNFVQKRVRWEKY